MNANRLRVIACLALGIGLVTSRSAHGQIVVTGPTIIERSAAPGESYRAAIPIRNSSSTPETARIYLADYVSTPGGSTRFEPPGSHARSNAGWIALSQMEVAVPPQGSVTVAYTVTVPAGQPLPVGTYWSVIFVEAVRPTEPLVGPGVRVNLSTRYAVQIVTNIGSTGEARVAFDDPRVEGRQFVIGLTDTGTRSCRPSLRLEVYRQDGSPVQTLMAQRGILYPGMPAQQKFDLPELPPGTYTFLLLADVGAPTVQGAKYQIQIP